MTELEKYETVNAAATLEELQAVVLKLNDENGLIQGRSEKYPVEMMAHNVRLVVDEGHRANLLTRSYGIRQQALYLREYTKH